MTRGRIAAAALAACLLAGSCSSGSGPRATGSPSRAPSPSGTHAPSPSESPSPTASSSPSGAPLPAAPSIHVPAAFRAEVFASGLETPTAMAFGPDGRLYLTQNGGQVVALTRGSARPSVLATGFPVPLGLTWIGKQLFVSAQGELDRLTLSGSRLTGRTKLVTGLPFGEHQQDNVVVGADGRLYLGSGSTCNVCQENDHRSAAILSVKPDGTDLRVVATGTRNPFGLAVQPGTGRLFASVNGQDYIGTASDPEPADMLVWVRSGAKYGWPTCWPDARTLSLTGSCGGITPPAAYLEPHAAAAGMAFYTGSSFPASDDGDLFLAEWGEYKEALHGRKLIRIVLGADGTAPISHISVFATGFAHPIAVAVDPQGGLLVADWGTGRIDRIQAKGAP